VEWKKLGEVCLPTENIKWNENKDKYHYIDLTSVSRETHKIIETTIINAETAPSRAQKIIKKGDVIFATTRPTLKRFAIIEDQFDKQIASTGFCVLSPNTSQVLTKWIYFNLYTVAFNNYVEKKQEGSAYPSISDAKVKEYNIPIPPLSEQERIVAILDKFDALVNDLTIVTL
jgi:Restriction endonuclease S subunits